jgi:hypothetical protein
MQGTLMIGCLAGVGPRAEAEEIKRAIKDFLRETLKLELSLRENADYARPNRGSEIPRLPHRGSAR